MMENWTYSKGSWFRDFPEIGWSVSIFLVESYDKCYEIIEEVGSEELLHETETLVDAMFWVMEKAYELALGQAAQ